MKNESTKAAKKQYIPTAEFYSQVIDSLQDYSIFTLDLKLRINSWNSGATNIFHYETDEIIGKPFEIIFTDEDKKKGIPDIEIENAILKGRATDIRWHLAKDGNLFYAHGLVFPLIDEEGERFGFVKILRDITEQKKSEDAIKKNVTELEELNTHKDSVLAIVSHDLRSPLSGIIGTAAYLKSNFDKMEQFTVQEMLDLLHKSAVDELKMLDYLVEWSRIKYATEIFSPTKIELIQYVKDVFDSLSDLAAVKTLNLHQEIEENTTVFADGKMLLSILQNIVSNAIKHSVKGGKISITAKRKEDKMIIEVKDTGIGMTNEIIKKLFTPQLSALALARKEDKGAGIGLLLVKGFLERNSGEIWVESVEGEGSSFYFTLPIDKTPEGAKT
jgi:two-component system CheB/CheR fusion protein